MADIVPYADMERMANAIAKSKLFGMKTPDEALALMCVAQAEGRHPGSVAVEYHIIQGRPTLKADTMLARFQAAGGKVTWTEYTDTRVAGIFAHPQGGSVEIDWTFERAKKAKLTSKDNWVNYPRQMLRARVISEGVRTVYPGVAIGIYTPEEVLDFAPDVNEALRAAQPLELTAERDPSAEAPHTTPEPEGVPTRQAEPVYANTNKCTAKQAKLIHAKLGEAGIARQALYSKYNVENVEDLEFRQINAVIAWIDAHQ